MELPVSFIHISSPPSGYYYECEEFKKNVIIIWLCNTHRFDYNNGAVTRTIHSFYNTKTNCYHAPINSSTVGSVVDIKHTTQYSAMQLNLNSLMSAFV